MNPVHHTHRLDWDDATIREWDCTVLWSDPADPEAGIVLDRSAFYPGGGGQPPDHGVLIWQGVQTRIVGTRKGDDLYLLPAPGDPVPPVGCAVHGALDDERRTSLMRTHSGLHVLCGTVFRDFGALVTGGNMEPGEARMDFNLPDIPADFKQSLEDAVNAEIAADRAIEVKLLPRDVALAIPDIVRTQARFPPETTEMRIVDIVGLDAQADGGTHVASTSQIGHVQVYKVENKGRQNRRVRIRLTDRPVAEGAAMSAASVAIIGLGSRGLGVLERLLCLADTADPELAMRIEVIDPAASGAGVHDRQQPDYLLLNTICSQVSMFPDAGSVDGATGMSGPSLYEWACERELRIADDGYTVGPRGRPIRPTDFLPRRLLGDYLAWFGELLLARQSDRFRITVHRSEAVDLTTEPDGGLLITLASGDSVRASRVFLTTGYTANLPAADRTGRLISEPYPMPARFEQIRAGQTVAISGFGLSAMDAVSSLTVGRGGRFAPDGAGVRYLASGHEPTLLLYSRTGLPCRARLRTLEFGPRYEAIVFTPANISALRAARGGALDFYADIWPMVLDELRVCYRRYQARLAGPEASQQLALRLLTAQADRRVGALLDALDRESGPFDPTRLLDPSPTMCLQDSRCYQDWFAELIRSDLVEGELGFAGSLVKATLDILRDLRDTFRFAVDFGGVTERSLELFHADTVPTLNRAVVGPQFERHAELLALLRAGLLQVPFGPNPGVDWDAARGSWLLRSRHLSTECSRFADWLVAGQVGLPTVASSASPLINSLYRQGRIRPLQAGSRLLAGIDIDREQHPLAADGQADQRIWVLGPICEGATFYNNLVPSPGGYSRPVYDAHRCVTALLGAGRMVAQPA